MRWKEILFESVKKYMPMFDAFLNAANTASDEMEALSWRPQIEAKIREVEQSLKREDRVVWYLRWYRLNLCMRYVGLNDVAVKDSKSFTPFQKLFNRYVSEIGMGNIPYSVQAFLLDERQLSHWANFPAQKIQAVVWDKQLPSELIAELTEIEQEWAKARKQELRHDDDYPEVFLDFHNGWAWYDLNTGSCSAEANAMGHCGNAGAKHGDTILSLRRRVGDNLYRPSLTFILSEDGLLGEMKGRANEKPKERYHDMIVALLRDPRITGIDGGGYAPENNFSLRDLDDDERIQLQKEKPELRELPELYDLYERENTNGEPDPKLKARIARSLESDLKSRFDRRTWAVDMDRGLITVWVYSSVKDYLDMNLSYCKWLEELFDEDLAPAMASMLQVNLAKCENICQAAKRSLFMPLFKELLPVDHDYKVSSTDGGGEMEVEMGDDGKIRLLLPISQYLHLFWGEDSGDTMSWLEGNLDSVEEHRHGTLDEIFDGDDFTPVENLILRYLNTREIVRSSTTRYGRVPPVNIPPELIKEVYREFKGSADDGFTDAEAKGQGRFDFLDDDI